MLLYSDEIMTSSVIASVLKCNSTGSPPYEFTDYTQRAIVGTLYLIVSLTGLIGNSLVILAVILSKKLRTTTNAFVVNLSIADLLTCLVIPWDAVALLGKDGLPVGEWICSVVAVVQFTTVGCSIFTLASIGLNRWLLITRPGASYRNIFKTKKIAVWLVLTWLVPLLVTIIPPLADVGAVGYNARYRFCGSVTSHPSYNTYNIIIGSVLYPTPFVVIICYVLIWRHVYRHSKRLRNPNPSVQFTSSSSCPQPQSQLPQTTVTSTARSQASSFLRYQTDITKNMFYIVCAFIVCLGPFAICPSFEACDPAVPYTAAILFANSCINPLIYATKHRDFKTVFGCIVRCHWDSIPESSDFLKRLQRRS
ncbi:G-protein coupled receptor moody-like [Patiria miniata]|uniref:G-protein coupled receptors family 1 profile domain-containing protein n=1 Tax=Patiria miniata TaxID=46514 RepID=A0A913Z080_PATMI|nr:G-protein coupled receptor moody-like [Patiria miniata]